MKKSTYIALSFVFILLAACNSSSTGQQNEEEITEEVTTVEPQETVAAEETAKLSELDDLIGEWTVDAATAGVKMNLTFNKDGSFKQILGKMMQNGTWEVIDDKHVKVATPNSKGQTWLITDLNDASVNICWNPDSPKPKTIPMQRVK